MKSVLIPLSFSVDGSSISTVVLNMSSLESTSIMINTKIHGKLMNVSPFRMANNSVMPIKEVKLLIEVKPKVSLVESSMNDA